MAKAKKDKKAKINAKLDGFEVSVDNFGEVKTTMDIDKINSFLDEEVEDKKFKKKKK